MDHFQRGITRCSSLTMIQIADLMRFEPKTFQTQRKTVKPAKNDALLKSVLQHKWAMHHTHRAKGHK